MPWATRIDNEVVGVGQYVRVGGVGTVMVIFLAGMPVRDFERDDLPSLRLELAHFEAIGVVTQAQVRARGWCRRLRFIATAPTSACATKRRCARGWDAEARGRGSSCRRWCGRSDIWCAGADVHGDRHEAGHEREESVRNAVAAMKPQRGEGGRAAAHAARGGHRRAPDRARWRRAPTGARRAPRESAETTGAAARDAAVEPAVEAPSTTTASADDAVEAAAVGVEIERQQPSLDGPADAAAVAAQRATEFTLARMGMIEELFPTGSVPYAGVMLAMAMLPVTGLLDAGSRGPPGRFTNGLYGVRAVVTTLVAMALLRCKRPEQLERPTALGAVVGLARAPEMKALGKVGGLAADEGAVVALVREMARRHVDRVRVTRSRSSTSMAMCGPTSGRRGWARRTTRITPPPSSPRPRLLAVGREGSARPRGGDRGQRRDTTTMPHLLDEARRAVGPDLEPTARARPRGLQPQALQADPRAQLPPHHLPQGQAPEIRRRDFETISVRRGGREHPTLVCDKRVRIKGYGLMRCVAVLRDDGRQTHVLTTRTPEQLPTREVLERMFSPVAAGELLRVPRGVLRLRRAVDLRRGRGGPDADGAQPLPGLLRPAPQGAGPRADEAHGGQGPRATRGEDHRVSDG